MKRWIIRSLFVGLLLLCVGGWAGSYRWVYGIRWNRTSLLVVYCVSGSIAAQWDAEPQDLPLFAVVCLGDEEGFKSMDGGVRIVPKKLGFHVQSWTDPEVFGVIIPFWFPTCLAAVLLWLVWRKTRPKINPAKAFPVELAKPSEAHKPPKSA